ncbi:AAA family ATPase [Paenibacillus sp. LMG 31461]|uniref:AAA family ATPase n=1 Tax=Paenibacillus plantarum TaxID=2654975 RepID=A0ABX1X4A4_9BACL|nr:TniB family NTP-binding protein [Paenibacillus plantarum]NOU63224.1 AAA family ATPase [Paenibacillus plantarum]
MMNILEDDENRDDEYMKKLRSELEFPEEFDQVKKIKQSLDAVKNIVVYHGKFNNAINEVRRCHLVSIGSKKPELLFLHGDYGTGKSTVLGKYVEKYPRYDEGNKTIVPVLIVEIPANAKPKDVASKFLFELGDPFYSKGTEKVQTCRAISMAIKCRVQMVIFDELQHALETETQKVLRQTADWIKSFVNEVKVPVILCGMTDSEKIFKANPQLASRFKRKVELTPFKPDKQFQSFLQKIDESLPFQRLANLSDIKMAMKLFYVCKGTPRILLKLLEEAVGIAAQLNQSRLSEFDLFEAFNRLDFSDRPKIINPFLNEEFDLLKALDAEGRFVAASTDESKKPKGKK